MTPPMLMQGVLASQIQGHLNTGSFDWIQTLSPSGVSTASFTSILQTYAHLQIRAILRNDVAAYAGSQALSFRFNGDTAANYSSHLITNQPDNAPAAGAGNDLGGAAGIMPYLNISDGGLANTFALFIMDIPDYTNPNKYKTAQAIGGVDQNNTAANTGTLFDSFHWRSVAAITQIDIITGAGNYKAGTRFSLYGSKG